MGEQGFSLNARREGGGTPILNNWGANSDYGTLRSVLLGPIENYKWLKTSSLSKKSLRRGVQFDPKVAQAQHAEMVDAYRSADVEVNFHKPDPHLPYQVYARDSSVMTPMGAIITHMAQPWRRGENFRAIETYHDLGIPIYDYVTAGTFEGGDFNVIEPGAVLIGWEGPEGRSSEEGAKQIGAWMEAEGWEVMLMDIDPYYVHIDLMVVMLAPKLAAVCIECTDPKVVDWLKSKNIEIIEVPFQETMALGCNVVALGEDRVLLPAASKTLKEKLKALGFTIYDPELDMITQGGGGVHCMCQSLIRDPG
ncbi:arginine deiminase family protein [Shimia thalassica]|uniref:arginine deiminase n=1 Tax=Shimia thalassica TaxID=1715693 RepID=A0A0P1IYS1_9RHOB|nr:arginine deiminase family protein [Shimia thalassica]PHO04703.1 amidinotransferase [Rhodobacteraceae bacterium 4F10]MBU2943309.1 amidinotransferase [Shimia thalassica]MDO6478889.1 arginine deiminase family protein [Shimia thalassica]MDO6484388.1 arginine deiminase family protein [Shimia thalassica]MDO6501378.1 arginine deiminase family protein [Shimia thalassica]